jgi:hypothetical protein
VSGDFSAEAIRVGEIVGLPVRWLDVDLDNLERLLRETLAETGAE